MCTVDMDPAVQGPQCLRPMGMEHVPVLTVCTETELLLPSLGILQSETAPLQKPPTKMSSAYSSISCKQ